MPEPLDTASITPVLAVLESLLPNTTGSDYTIYATFVEAMNKRIGSSCGSLGCLMNTLNSNKAAGAYPGSFTEAAAMPEFDGWTFGGNYSYVCSAFAAKSLQVGLGSLMPAFNATEQTPRDGYSMAMYDGGYWTQANCPGGVQQTPAGTFCQISGPVVLPLTGYNSIPLYESMNSFCGSQWPNYERCPGGGSSCQC